MHTNPETLALLALGEPAGTSAERAHVAECPTCSAEVSDLTHLAEVGRTTDATDTMVTPNPEVWDRICAELGFETSAVNDGRREATAQPMAANGAAVTDLSSRPGRSVAAAPQAEPTAPSPFRRRLLGAIAAGIALLLIGIGIGVGIDRLRGDNETVVASTPLAPLPAYAGTNGEAQLVVDREGRRYLKITVSSTRPLDVERQVWVLSDARQGAMKNLGVLAYSGQEFSVEGIDLIQFPVVDVSAEPDANPEHSGMSIVQGKLDL